MTEVPKLTAADVLRRYRDESLPEFLEMELDDVNQVGIFGNRPIHIAATRGDMDELIALINGGADVNGSGEHSHTPLHDAAGQGHMEAVKLLLAHGASPTKKNDFDETAADVVPDDREDIIDLLK